MRPAKNSKITDHSLINNTKSIKRKPVCAFNIKTYPRLQKNSNIYKMLKYGPLPDGDYKFLIQNGKITKYARWQIISADLDLRFVELCLLVKIMNLYEALRDRGIIKLILREWLFGQFCFDFDYSTIRNALTTLRKRGLIDIAQLRSVSCTDEKVLEIQDVIRGPVGVAGIAIMLISGCFAIADIFIPSSDDAPDEKPLFGDFLIGAIDEIIYYLRWAVYLTIIGGGLMIGISLRLTNTTHMMKTK